MFKFVSAAGQKVTRRSVRIHYWRYRAICRIEPKAALKNGLIRLILAALGIRVFYQGIDLLLNYILSPKDTALAVFLIMFGVFALLLAIFRTVLAAFRAARYYAHHPSLAKEFHFDDEAVTLLSDGNSLVCQYGSITHMYRRGSFFYLFTSNSIVMILDTDIMTGGTPDEFADFLHRKTGKDIAALKFLPFIK